MMELRNYTNIKHREKRLYSMFDTTISKTGILVGSIYLSFIMLIPFTLLGALFCKITNKLWYNPVYILTDTRSEIYFFLLTIVLPICMGVFLNTYHIQNLKAIDYFKMLCVPKTPKSSDNKKIKETKYTIDALVEKL